MTPLVPANVDLRDFAFMPFEFQRLFASETWVLSNDAEKVAAITLWGMSWKEVPAGSLPCDDRMLAHLSGAGSRWKKVKEMALRGWKAADDGRLYHPVVCEKALEAWLEKLGKRLSSGAGNAARWGAEVDQDAIAAQITESRAMLAAINPQSRGLARRKGPGVPPGPKNSPGANPQGIPKGVPSGSQETGTGTGKVEAKASTPDGVEGDGATAPSPGGLFAGAEDEEPEPAPAARRRRTIPAVPHDEIIRLYHQELPMCSAVEAWPEHRMGLLRGRWREAPERQNPEWWRAFFATCRESAFLTGNARPGPGRDKPFIADLEWLLRPKNFLKVIEGKYHEAHQ